MSWLPKWSLLLTLFAASSLPAQLGVVDAPRAQTVFSGPARPIEVIFRNVGLSSTNVTLRTRLYQASSSTAAPFGNPEPWKNLQILPRQTVIESSAFDFPQVKAETHFLIQWIGEDNGIIGKSEILVFPTNLLSDLRSMAGAKPPGILDPGSHLKPSLKALGIEFEDLANSDAGKFAGNLAIVWTPSRSADGATELKRDISRLAKAGKAVVWIIPTEEPGLDAEPRMLPLQGADGTIVKMQSKLVVDFQSNPQSQLNLLRAVGIAIRPELLRFSEANQ